ncbi:helix-turn-helix domain-containing protein [Variovorax ureilyticus]|uniref:helix-turn-helix domain-containing protein n=1 Tax=Variovorax ureilyticus TaxID=1836198 RepID=UPI003D66997C
MSTENRALFAARLKEERERLGLSQVEMAELGGAKARTYQDWERAIATVSAEFLSVVGDRSEFDVLFVLTGVRSPASGGPFPGKVGVPAPVAPGSVQRYVTPEEAALLDNYEAADERGRAAARSVLDALAQPKRATG